MFYMHVCISTCMPDAYRGQKKESRPLGLEFQTFVDLHVDMEIKPRTSVRAVGVLNC